MNKTKKLTYTAIIAAITTASSTLIYIPLGFAKAFPIQHLANVISAVMLGPAYAVLQAILTSTMRNLLGTGSLFAYPGSIIGALLASILYAKTKNLELTALGEVIGTGILGAMATYPIGILFLGQDATLFGLIPAFTASSFVGALLAYVVLKVLVRNKAIDQVMN
ncbi:energy coupling factor transporter S component ThiW [Lysinibacillus endophyticus]|uniref:Energy coupling factor transporter S component ThiW n=1 Tax=Ureibacillus endophyticus TaxID=1978490 RepID=A0A494Z9S0_9BACL|nr:energy coupling factor transporter S component ThiW [Lysinibacillus endophyticus]RKQ19098.1 energy coupling factor transporter S component ThiW [Lysinibacillus endophyticus]